MTAPLLECRAVAKRYGRLPVLLGVDLDLPRGATLGLLGENGAGKSTLLRILGCIHRADSGSAHVLGISVDRHPAEVRARIGYVPQTPSFHEWMKVEEVVWFHSAFYPTWDSAEAEALRERLGLDPGATAGALSRGMRTRLALLLALAHRPELLVLDEPLAGLDPVVRRDVIELLIGHHQERGGTTLLSSHQTGEIDPLIDRVAFLEGGLVTREGERDAVLDSLRRIEIVYESEPPRELWLPGLLQWRRTGQSILADVEGFDDELLPTLDTSNVRRVEARRLDLEEAFVALTGRRAS